MKNKHGIEVICENCIGGKEFNSKNCPFKDRCKTDSEWFNPRYKSLEIRVDELQKENKYLLDAWKNMGKRKQDLQAFVKKVASHRFSLLSAPNDLSAFVIEARTLLPKESEAQ